MTTAHDDDARRSGLADALQTFRRKRLSLNEQPWYERLAFKVAYQFRDYYMAEPPAWRVAVRRLQSRRMVPDFASIGAVRSGTSALAEYIFQHPAVVLPLTKEVLGAKLWQIRAQMPEVREAEAVRARFGVAMTGYCTPLMPSIVWPFAARAVNPESRIVVIMRDPVERALSHWRWEHKKLASIGYRRDPIAKGFPSLRERVRVEAEAIRGGAAGFPTATGLGLLQSGIYEPFMKVLFDQFPRSQIHWLVAEDFFAEPITTVKGIYEFLGLPEFEPSPVRDPNAAPGLSDAVEQELRDIVPQLREFYRPYNERLSALLGHDFRWE